MDERERKTARHRWVIGLIVMGALILLVGHRSEPEKLAHVIASARPAWLVVAALLQLATYPCIALIWTFVLQRAGVGFPAFSSLIRLTVAELFADQSLPSGGMSGTLLVVASLERRGVAPRAAVAAVVSSLVGFYVAQIVAVMLAIVAVIAAGDFGGWDATASAIAVIGSIAIPVPLALTMTGALDKLPPRLQCVRAIAELRDRMRDAPKDVVFSPSVLATASVLRLAVFFFDGATLAIVLVAVGSPLLIVHAIAAFTLASVIGSASFLPGGIGTFEVVSVALLVKLGAPMEAAAPATLLLRGLSFWLPMIPGGWFARQELRAHVEGAEA
jgi:uncharacterized protein (TIRG00374 family)